MSFAPFAKSIVTGLLLAGLVRLQGGTGWQEDVYGLGEAGFVASDLLPLLPDDGRCPMDVLEAVDALDKGEGSKVAIEPAAPVRQRCRCRLARACACTGVSSPGNKA